jgi:hypothetical protein
MYYMRKDREIVDFLKLFTFTFDSEYWSTSGRQFNQASSMGMSKKVPMKGRDHKYKHDTPAQRNIGNPAQKKDPNASYSRQATNGSAAKISTDSNPIPPSGGMTRRIRPNNHKLAPPNVMHEFASDDVNADKAHLANQEGNEDLTTLSAYKAEILDLLDLGLLI